MTLLVTFCLRRRRKNAFDGNFDPAHVKGGGSGTLPKIDLGEDGLMGNNGIEDDGMGGRLGAGPGSGGIIMPYPFQLAAVSGTAVGSQRKGEAAGGVSAASAAGCSKTKQLGATRQQYVQQHTPNQPISSVSFYPSLFYPKFEMEANLKPVTSNPDGREQLPTFQEACMQTGSGPHPSAATSVVFVSDHVVVHKDGARVALLRKGDSAKGKREVLNSGVQPTCDRLPVDIKRGS